MIQQARADIARMYALQEKRVEVECELVLLKWETAGGPRTTDEMRRQVVLDHLDREIADMLTPSGGADAQIQA